MAKSQIKIEQTAGREALGEFAAEFAHLNDDVLFGEVWSRNDLLSLRDRSIVTVVSLVSQGMTDSSLKYHLETARKNGVTKTEIAEILTHIAFYAGWPKAWAAFRLAKEVWIGEEADSSAVSLEAYAQSLLFPVGNPNDTYAKYFVGQSYLAPVLSEGISVANVTFEPGCRNNWHIHHATKDGGQVLICVGGRGYYQEWGKEAVELCPGDAVYIPAEVKHWHGAAPDSWFSHLAIEVPGENGNNEWLEPVDDKMYKTLK
ncbi:MAG: carboxymuconolactone decarboxylase family protein [Porphyromonadaceae bacterium]|nr:carboxymuconolactone decarboxylase family protein [Porphyromonadaceae bacterium]